MSLPVAIQRGLMSGLPTARLSFAGQHLMGYLGDVEIAGWPAGTQIQYHNTGLHGNTWGSYTNEEIAQVFKNSGLFIPNTVQFHATPEGILGSTYTIDLTGIIPVAVNTADMTNTVEGYLANFFTTNPATAVYAPPPTISQTISQTGSVTATSTTPPVTVDPATGSGWIPVNSPVPYGIQTVLTNYTDQFSDFDVIFTDGTSGIFDSEGNYDSGTRGSITSIAELFDDNDDSIGAVAYLNNLVELYFDAAGNFTGGFAPAGSVVPTGAGSPGVPLSTVNTTTPDAIAAAIKKALGTGTPGAPSTGIDSSKILSSVGLGSLPLALGVGAGTALVGLLGITYLLVSGTLAGKGRR